MILSGCSIFTHNNIIGILSLVTCLYKRIFLDYTYGIGKIYTVEEIEKAKQSPSFEREYNLKYLGKIGNVFHTKDIEAAIEKGRKYNPDNFNRVYLTSRSRTAADTMADRLNTLHKGLDYKPPSSSRQSQQH